MKMNDTPGRNDPCWCGSGKKYKRCHLKSDRAAGGGIPHRASGPIDLTRKPAMPVPTVKKGDVSPIRTVPDEIPRPGYARTGRPSGKRRSCLKRPEEIPKMRDACAVAREILSKVLDAVDVGVTTEELDIIAHEAAVEVGGYPSTINYNAFPKALCTSVNEVICHGIPDSRPLEDGDIINCDFTIFYNGYHGDLSETIFVGSIDPEKAKLVRVTWEAMNKGIEAVRPGRPFNVIGKAIEDHVRPHGYSVVREFTGHGIGDMFHMDPHVLHHYSRRERTPIKENMTFTVEPMINAGVPGCRIWSDNWTAVTLDLQPSAQFEHTILVNEDGAEILTPYPDGKPVFMRQLEEAGLSAA